MTTHRPFASPPPLTPITAQERIDIIDVLRGFALLGILIVNLPYFAHPIAHAINPPQAPLWDQAATWLVLGVFESKFYVLFSWLFGYGLAIQIRRASARSQSTGRRYIRRLYGLLLLGVLQAVFLFVGDILVSYALIGALIWLVQGWPWRRLMWAGLVWLGLAVLGRLGLVALLSQWPEVLSQIAREADAATASYRGTFLQAAGQRVSDLGYFYLLTIFFTWPSALAMALLGLAAGKQALLDRPEQAWAAARRLLPWAALFGVAGNLAYASISDSWPIWLRVLVTLSEALSAPSLAFCYTLAIWRLTGRPALQRWFAPLRAAGQMSLSNYLGQALICGALFSSWGLGWFDQIGALGCLALALPIYLAQLAISIVWMRSFQHGPVEWLLRAWTYLAWPNWRRTARSDALKRQPSI